MDINGRNYLRLLALKLSTRGDIARQPPRAEEPPSVFPKIKKHKIAQKSIDNKNVLEYYMVRANNECVYICSDDIDKLEGTSWMRKKRSAAQ